MRSGSFRFRPLLTALAGPILIIASVLIALRSIAFGGMIPIRDLDVLGFWLGSHCYLGRSLAHGTIPGWDPFVMGGSPFASDPQSGWLYFPAMVLYAALPCSLALRAFIIFQPLWGGVGAYAFLRTQKTSRIAATVGGVMMSLLTTATDPLVSLPFAGVIAWTIWVLVCAARAAKAQTWTGRILWTTGAAICWGQVAAAHLSQGLVVSTAALALLLGFEWWTGARSGSLSAGQILGLAGITLTSLGGVNLAFFLPRLAYIPRTSLGIGYAALEVLQAKIAGHSHPPQFGLSPGAAMPSSWILSLRSSPRGGTILPAAGGLFALSALWSKDRRLLAGSLALFGVSCYLVSIEPVAHALVRVVEHLSFGDYYVHAPKRFKYGVLIVLPILTGLGFDAWLKESSTKKRLEMLIPGAAIWIVLPLLTGSPEAPLLMFLSILAAGVILFVVVRSPSMAPLFPLLLAGLLIIGDAMTYPAHAEGGVFSPGEPRLGKEISAHTLVTPGHLVDVLRRSKGARLLSLDPYFGRDSEVLSNAGERVRYAMRRVQVDRRALLFGIEESQAYNPVEPKPYWRLTHTVAPQRYNTAVFTRLIPPIEKLLQVGWVIARAGHAPPRGRLLAREEGFGLYRVPNPGPRAMVVGRWRSVSSSFALDGVIDSHFDPARLAFLLPGDGHGAGSSTEGSATFVWDGTQDANVRVRTDSPALVIVRNQWDPDWRARIAGKSVPVLRADYMLQAIPVPRGTETIHLSYRDPWIGRGLFGSGIVLAFLLLTAFGLNLRAKRNLLGDESAQRPRLFGS